MISVNQYTQVFLYFTANSELEYLSLIAQTKLLFIRSALPNKPNCRNIM
jgi:hypothetical protein